VRVCLDFEKLLKYSGISSGIDVKKGQWHSDVDGPMTRFVGPRTLELPVVVRLVHAKHRDQQPSTYPDP
jgi:hypothetical protein